LQEGTLHASAVRELTRVATSETEADWIAAAAGRRVREIERLVAGRARGDRPSDTLRPELARHMLRFEVSGETLAAFRQAMAWLREQSGERLDDDAASLMLARSVLYGAGSSTQTDAPVATETTAAPAAASQPAATHPAAGRSKYQIKLTVCEECGRGSQRAGADSIEIDPAMIPAETRPAATRPSATTLTPTWARWMNRLDREPLAAPRLTRRQRPFERERFHPQCVAACSSATKTAARSRAAGTRSTSMSSTSCPGPTAARTIPAT
jgi:hypothetical protein